MPQRAFSLMPANPGYAGIQTLARYVALLLVLAAGLPAYAQSPNPEEEKAVAAIEKLRGKVTRDDKLPGHPVVEVDLSGRSVTDADLKDSRELKGLQTLNLSYTKIADAGLIHLKELKNLQYLDLGGIHTTATARKDLRQALPHTMISPNP
jgi:internalin A